MRRRRFLEIAATVVAFAVPALLAVAPSPASRAGGDSAPPFVQAPPVFALRGAPALVTAVVSGRPDGVTLVVGSGRAVAPSPMIRSRRDPSVWTARAPAVSASYSVVASYGAQRLSSETYELTALDRIAVRRPDLRSFADSRLLSVPLRDLGVDDGAQAARILPSSFAVDARAAEVDILDEANARIVTYRGRRRTRSIPIATGSRTVSDLVRTPDGTRYLVDAVRDEIVVQSATGTRAFRHAGTSDGGVNARLTMGRSGVYVREPRQGRALRVLDTSGRRVARSEPDGSAAIVAVSGHSMVVGAGRRGVRIDLGTPVLDVVDQATDGRGIVWAIADVTLGRTARTVLVSTDVRRAVVRAAYVDASVFGDVTRRLVTLRDGAVVMSASRSALTFTRYTEATHVGR